MMAAGSNDGSRSVARRHRTRPDPAASNHGGERRDSGSVSGRKDPFPGPAPLPRPRVKRFLRGSKEKAPRARGQRLRWHLKAAGEREEAAAARAARLHLLLPEEPGFLEADPGEDTCTVTQGDIAEAVDIASAAKHFELRLEQFGPYRLDYTRNGRQLLLGGRRGHVAAVDWQTKALLCEFNAMEAVADVAWLHAETLLAVAQRRWLHVYDRQGLELNVLKSFAAVLRLQFLPYHFLLAAANATGFLQYLDVSVGKEVAAHCTRGGRLAVMEQNPANAVVHLGHSNGTVTLWSPNVSEPLARLLCHRGALRALAVDATGTFMASAGLDRKLRVTDLRTYRALQELVLPQGAAHLAFSQRGLLAAACGDAVQVYKGVGGGAPPAPYLCHRPPRPPHALRFCPFEDVLGAGHGAGFTSILVPGAGEANFDALEANPYRSRRQRQEWEVKALLEKVPAALITLDPAQLGRVDAVGLQQKRQERIQRLGFDPQAKVKFTPRRRAKGSDPLRRKRQMAHEEQRAAIRQSVEQREQERRRRERKEGGEGGAGPSPPPNAGPSTASRNNLGGGGGPQWPLPHYGGRQCPLCVCPPPPGVPSVPQHPGGPQCPPLGVPRVGGGGHPGGPQCPLSPPGVPPPPGVPSVPCPPTPGSPPTLGVPNVPPLGVPRVSSPPHPGGPQCPLSSPGCPNVPSPPHYGGPQCPQHPGGPQCPPLGGPQGVPPPTLGSPMSPVPPPGSPPHPGGSPGCPPPH